jgi:hypothetical protein
MKKVNNTYITGLFNKLLNESLENKADDIVTKIESMGGIDSMMREPQIEEGDGEVCEQCGSGLNESGMCEQCDMKEEDELIYELEMEDDFEEDGYEDENEFNDDACKYHMTHFGKEDERTRKFCKGLTEGKKLKGNQHKLDKNKNNKIDSEDFKLLKKDKKNDSKSSNRKFGMEGVEMEEGNAFSGALAKAKKEGKDSFEVDGKKYNVKESKTLKLTENELVDLIETIVKEQKSNITTGNAPGLTKYRTIHTKDGKENSDALKEVGKKMEEYVKPGSKSKYETDPKHFPKGNGELEKINKKAYIPSKEVQDYTDAFAAAGQENLDYDEIKPNEEWLDKNVEGSSKTGNNPEWGNAVETDVNKRRNKIRKDNLLAKAKRKAYNKSPQPVVIDRTGEDEGDEVLRQLESVDPRTKKPLNEEFEKMKKLISYNVKTQ